MKKTHLSLLILISLLLILSLTWSPQLEKTTKVMPERVTQATIEHIELRFGHNVNADSAMHQAALRFAEEVSRKSSGRVKVTVFPAQQLGNDHEMVEMARAGELDILLTPTAKMSVPVPAMQYPDIPFLFPSRDDAYALLDGEVGQMLLERMRPIGLVGVTFWENGFKHFTGNRPLLRPDDFKGLDIRVMKSRILMEQFKAFGANPVPIDFYATRKALADGVVDGEENPLIAIVSMGFHEVQSDLTLSGHGYLPYVFSISEKVFSRLPHDVQQILTETARELTTWERAETQRREEKLLQTIRDASVHIHTVDEAARREFAAKTAYIADRYEAVIGADIMSKTQEYLYRKYEAQPADSAPIVIGQDSDLSMDAKISGLAIKRGATLAIKEINSRGGVLGKPLRLIARDHKGMPSAGIENLSIFAGDDNVVAVLGGQHGSVVNAELETIHKIKLPFLAPWSAVAKLADNGYQPNFVFRLSANDRTASSFIVDYALRKGIKPAILYENSVWGRESYELMQQHLEEKGHEFVYAEAINRGGTVNFTAIMKKVTTAAADTIIMVLKPQEGGELLEKNASMKRPLSVTAHWGIIGGETWKQHKAAIAKQDLAIFQTFSFLDNKRPQARALAQRYRDYYGVASNRMIEAPSAVAHAYDLVQVLALAIEKAGTTERTEVRNALEKLQSYDGAIKHYQPPFTPQRHDALDMGDYRMVRYAADGALVPIH